MVDLEAHGYDETLVSYIDILGFADLLKRA